MRDQVQINRRPEQRPARRPVTQDRRQYTTTSHPEFLLAEIQRERQIARDQERAHGEYLHSGERPRKKLGLQHGDSKAIRGNGAVYCQAHGWTFVSCRWGDEHQQCRARANAISFVK